MALAAGARLGPYEILSAIGAGGMGEVYRARDTKLDRDVAIKVLPELFVSDPERVARFQREAKTLASLNHPHIGGIYGLEDTDGVHALVLELVEGPTLADRIAQGPNPLEDALPIGRQIAEALEAAHEAGIVHRDLKPANIKLRPDGTVKVLDFGLAKVLDAGSGATRVSGGLTASPTITTPAMTAMGVILGTAAYMSPEQAKGRPADKRSDIWAFGAVLYEMLSGQRAFEGEDTSDTLAAVLRQDIDWTALPASTPAPVRRLIARCLDRDVRRRLRDIGEARIVLDDPAVFATADTRMSVSGGDVRAVERPVAPPRALWRRAIPVVLAAIITSALAGVAAWYLKPMAPLAVTRFPFTLPEGQAFSNVASIAHLFALSPDGSQIVYVASPNRLYLRSLSQLDVKAIQGTEGYEALAEPAFSPDGQSVAFFALPDRALKRIPVTGGAAVTVCPMDNPSGISWGPDAIVFGQGPKGILSVSPNGGKPDVLVSLTEGEFARGPQVLPDGRHVLFSLATGSRTSWDDAHIVVQSLTSGERKTLIERGSDARYLPTGHIVYAHSGSLFAVAFDPQRLELKGGPTPIVEGVRQSASGAAHFSVSSTGSLIYVPGPVSASSTLMDVGLMDRKGGIELLKLPPGPYVSPRVSPDGTRLALGTDDDKEAIVWIYDLSGATAMRRLTFGGKNRFPIWSSDGKHVAFQSDRDGDLAIFWQPADGGTAERLTKPDRGTSHVAESWSPKGDKFLYTVTKGSDMSVWTFSLQDKSATPFDAVHSSNPPGAVFSPDERWVAYTSTEGGTTTVYVQPFPATGAKYQLFAKGSDDPHEAAWSRDGTELFYNPRVSGFEAVSVTTKPTFAFGNPVALPKPFPTSPASRRRAYDITPGGKFMRLFPAGQTESGTFAARQIQVVLNWSEELKQRVPTR
jgi:Tol biopolymer transport system component